MVLRLRLLHVELEIRLVKDGVPLLSRIVLVLTSISRTCLSRFLLQSKSFVVREAAGVQFLNVLLPFFRERAVSPANLFGLGSFLLCSTSSVEMFQISLALECGAESLFQRASLAPRSCLGNGDARHSLHCSQLRLADRVTVGALSNAEAREQETCPS